MADDIPTLWKDIDDLLRKKAPKRQKELQAGLPEGELREIGEAFGRPIPEDYLVSIAIHDGNSSLNEFTDLPFRSVLEIWEAMNESEAAGEFGERQPRLTAGMSHVRYGHACRPRVVEVRCPRCGMLATARKPSEVGGPELVGELGPSWSLDDWEITSSGCSFRAVGPVSFAAICF